MFADTAKAKGRASSFQGNWRLRDQSLSGDVHALFVTYTVAASLAKAGKVRARPLPAPPGRRLFPGYTHREGGGLLGVEAVSWVGVFAPVNTPPNLLDKLSSEIVKDADVPR